MSSVSVLPKQPKSMSFTPSWCDYIELLCLINPDGFISKADVLDRIADEEDVNKKVANTREDEESFFQEKNNDSKQNNREQKIDDYFRHLSYREGAFKQYGFYPFSLAINGDYIQIEKSDLTLNQQLYIFLLVASNLNSLKDGYWHKITQDFEVVSHFALKKMLPDTAEVHIFGKGPSQNSRYKGNLWQKINRLANDLRERVIDKEDNYLVQDTGDNGLDLVGWVPVTNSLYDPAGGVLCIFGQCACTEKWVEKQHSSSAEAWRSIMTLTSPPSNMVFIPFSFRNSNGEWWKPKDIHQTIVIDRVRFAYLLHQETEFFSKLSTYEIVSEIINYTEPLV